MSILRKNIHQRIAELQKIICEKTKDIAKAPEGVLNAVKTESRTQYYLKEKSSDKIKRYLKSSETPLIAALCQKDYDQKVLASAQKELKQLERIQNTYPKDTFEDVYERLNDQRRKFVTPISPTNEEFVTSWEQFVYQGKGFWENAPEYYTDKGERVRSKSEILIANALNKHNVPYRYECPLYLKGYGKIHPDFTVLNVRLRKELFWEHMGMMDDPDYLEEALERILMYERNDIFPGDKLILTHETMKHPMNSKNIEKMIFQYLK